MLVSNINYVGLPVLIYCNRGVFICIRCSGIHRSMGTHISRVKSVDLDTWNTEQMEVSNIFISVGGSNKFQFIVN